MVLTAPLTTTLVLVRFLSEPLARREKERLCFLLLQQHSLTALSQMRCHAFFILLFFWVAVPSPGFGEKGCKSYPLPPTNTAPSLKPPPSIFSFFFSPQLLRFFPFPSFSFCVSFLVFIFDVSLQRAFPGFWVSSRIPPFHPRARFALCRGEESLGTHSLAQTLSFPTHS